MRTQLPKKISNVAEAKTFLGALIYNKEIYHLDDDAHDIIWDLPEGQEPTAEEKDQLNKLMDDIFQLQEWENGEFEPYSFVFDILHLDKPDIEEYLSHEEKELVKMNVERYKKQN